MIFSSSFLPRRVQTQQDSSFHNLLANANSSACEAAAQNAPFTTNKSINVLFYYEILTFDEPLVVGFAIEKAVKDHLIEILVLEHCSEFFSSSSSSSSSSTAPANNTLVSIRGAAIGGSSVLSYCVDLKWDQQDKSVQCYRMVGSVTVFLDEDMAVNVPAVEATVLAEILKSFKDGLIGPERIDGIQAIETVREPNMLSPTSAEKRGSKTTHASLDTFSLVGIILLVIAGAIFLATGIYVVVGKCKDMEMEEQLEEELSYRDNIEPRQRSLSLESSAISIDFACPQPNQLKGTETAKTVNPFTHREGRTLQWRNVNMVVVRFAGFWCPYDLTVCFVFLLHTQLTEILLSLVYLWQNRAKGKSPSGRFWTMYGVKYRKEKQQPLWVDRVLERQVYSTCFLVERSRVGTLRSNLMFD